MTQHMLDASVTAPWWDRDAPPRLTIDSGDTVVFQCPEPCGQVTPEWTAADVAERWDTSKVHALLGPVDVRGAKAGGSIRVEILDIAHHGWGWSGLIPGFGLLHERFAEAALHHWPIDDRGCHLGRGDLVVPFEPFVGCIGVAPRQAGRLDTMPPRANGGNLDVRDTTIGSTVTLPVFRDGAGVSIGDGHAAQGDGELCGTAIEAPLTVTARLTAVPDTPASGIVVDAPPRDPWKQRDGLHLTIGLGQDVRAATRQAVEQMLDHVASTLDLPEPLAMMLISAVCDVRIAQAVNEPSWTVAAGFPKALLSG